MALWFLRGIRRGVVTTTYPAATDEWAAQLPTPPRFDPAGLTPEVVDRLVGACPSGALQGEGRVLVMDVGRCTACGHCVDVAPHAAAPSGLFELAVGDRSALIKLIPIQGSET
jgi:dissimilatory sulfite reductase (desulfoviridin) alpha/beta subunit